ncbi:MAG: hypothetical protein K2Q18_17760 [Bdellovibrionales bacterium]|nr:hypothetical protein [Bdellovibrionales bacterium]
MKIFPGSATSSSQARSTEKPSGKEGSGKITRKKAETPAKKEMSPESIKEKLAAHVGLSDAAKNTAVKNTKKLGEAFMNADVAAVKASKENVVSDDVPSLGTEEIKTPNTKDLTLKSDIALNDPKDTNTQEKLKAVLSRGAFSFSSKEKEALEKILS